MRFDKLLKINRNLPLVETHILRPYFSSLQALRIQLNRWVKAGRLMKLRNGIYFLPEHYRKIEIFDLYVASTLIAPSYLSLEKALEYHQIIPEGVNVYTSLTTKRENRFKNPLGIFKYQHIQIPLFWGYEAVSLNQQTAFVATPEKALLDLIYIKKINFNYDYLFELRLQNLDQINCQTLLMFARRFDKKKIIKAATLLVGHIQNGLAAEKSL